MCCQRKERVSVNKFLSHRYLLWDQRRSLHFSIRATISTDNTQHKLLKRLKAGLPLHALRSHFFEQSFNAIGQQKNEAIPLAQSDVTVSMRMQVETGLNTDARQKLKVKAKTNLGFWKSGTFSSFRGIGEGGGICSLIFWSSKASWWTSFVGDGWRLFSLDDLLLLTGIPGLLKEVLLLLLLLLFEAFFWRDGFPGWFVKWSVYFTFTAFTIVKSLLIYTRHHCRPIFEILQANSSKISPQCNDFSDFEKSVNCLQILARFLLGFCLEILKICVGRQNRRV